MKRIEVDPQHRQTPPQLSPERHGLQEVHELLVGVDEEGKAEGALAAAVELGRIFGAQVQPIHVIPTSVLVGEAVLGPTGPTAPRAMRAVLESLEAAYGRTWRKAGTGPLITEGHVAETLLRVAKAEGADLLMVGPHTRHGALDLSNTVRTLLAHARVPVWIQPPGYRPFNRILVAVDLSHAAKALLQSGLTLGAAMGAEVEAVYYFDAHGREAEGGSITERVWRQEQVLFSTLTRDLDTGEVPFHAEIRAGRPLDEILSREEDFDLIIVGTHGRSGAWRSLLGGTAQGLVQRTRAPVLVVPTRAP